ncbi:MAG: hypothetical protein R6U98_01750, partial [Pirellulaceae bacterium]
WSFSSPHHGPAWCPNDSLDAQLCFFAPLSATRRLFVLRQFGILAGWDRTGHGAESGRRVNPFRSKAKKP